MDGWIEDNNVQGARGSSSPDDGGVGSGGSDGGDEVVRPSLGASITIDTSSINRVELNGKIADDRVAVYPALVPRKLRSAIHKRCSASASPPASNAIKRIHHAYRGISGGKRFKKSMVTDPLTKDEEEVIEALSALASIVTDANPIVKGTDKGLASENADIKAFDTSMGAISKIVPEEAVNVVDAELDGESTHPSHDKETFEKAEILNPSTRADAIETSEVIIRSAMLNIDPETKNVAEQESQNLPSTANDECSFQPNGGSNIPFSVGTLFHVFPSNGKLQVTQLERQQPLESGVGLLPHTPAPARQKDISKERHLPQHVSTREENDSNKLNMVPSTSSRANWTETFFTGTAARPDTSCCIGRSYPTGTELLAQKNFMDSRHRKGSWKKCATHVSLSHFIRKYQNTEINHDRHTPVHQLKGKRDSGVVADTDLIGRKNGPSGNPFDCGLRTDDGHPTPPGTCTRLQPTFDFMSLSTCCGAGDSGSKPKSSGKPPLSYLQPLPPHHHTIPFLLPSGHHPSYPEQISGQELPHYVGHPSYGLHFGGHAGVGSPAYQQQRQQLWRSHLTSYQPPVIFKWQNGGPQDRTLVRCPVPPSSTDEQISLLQSDSFSKQISPIPFLTNNMKWSHQETHQKHHGMRNEGQLQLLCNAQRL